MSHIDKLYTTFTSIRIAMHITEHISTNILGHVAFHERFWITNMLIIHLKDTQSKFLKKTINYQIHGEGNPTQQRFPTQRISQNSVEIKKHAYIKMHLHDKTINRVT